MPVDAAMSRIRMQAAVLKAASSITCAHNAQDHPRPKAVG
jgi:hypothetical protein